MDRGRVNLYSGIDVHRFIPALHEEWLKLERPSPVEVTGASNPVMVSGVLCETIQARAEEQVIVEGDDEDRPPVVEICVGRERELREIAECRSKAAFITGLGGQGKSTVAARHFDNCQTSNAFSYFVWRDCKEESERFENQLASVIERLSNGKISGDDISKQDIATLSEILLRQVRELRVLFVFDNVDHYVDLEAGSMGGSLDIFVRLLLQADTPSQVVFTCRPNVFYKDSHTVRLQGLTLESAVELFKERGAPSELDEIREAHAVTHGHSFWLDLLAIQVAKRASLLSLSSLVNEIRAGGGTLPTATLLSIWSTLKDREKVVLRSMAETVKPETETTIADYLNGELAFNKVVKAVRALRSLNLIVVKQRPQQSDVLELHPLVRQFVRNSFASKDRLSFIERIIVVYRRHIGIHKPQLAERPNLTVLLYWTESVELDIAAGRFEDAFLALEEVSFAFSRSSYAREFCRTARALFGASDWQVKHEEYNGFERVFKQCVQTLAQLGEYADAEALLSKYETTLPNKDVRYISYCQMRCYVSWAKGDFTDAVVWGKRGVDLKEGTDVDIFSDPTHSYALALRDAGQAESALPIFLAGRSLADVIDPDELDENLTGSFYGNVGRCLHFLGLNDEALVCYQKSALMLEKTPHFEHVTNQGYARAWIGEIFMAREQYELAYAFLRAAYLRWERVSPPKARRIALWARDIHARLKNSSSLTDEQVEKICKAWILGERVEAEFQLLT